jgi:hypothetical protein
VSNFEKYMNVNVPAANEGSRVNLHPESMKHTVAGDSKDYITLDDEIKPTEELKATNAIEADPNEVDYRSIETPKKPQDDVEVKQEQEESIGESFEEYVKRRTIELNRQLDKVTIDTTY